MPFVRSRWLGCIVVVVWCLSAFINPAAAFFPTAWRQQHFGNNGISHEQQTEEAFEQLAQRYWPKRTRTRSMSNARVAIASANADVDRDWDHSAFHCDGENFDGAQTRLSDLKNETIFHLKAGKAADAQRALGSALHTLQDFYSHSNWIEMGNTGPHPDFGTGRKMVYADAKNATCATCSSTVQKNKAGCPLCIPLANSTIKFAQPVKVMDAMGDSTEMLTSGYAFGEDMPRNKTAGIPGFKCHHGGRIDNPWGAGIGFISGMVRGYSIPGINKDSLDCGFSPHAHLHMAAVNASIKATIQYVDEIKQKIDDTQLRMLFGTGSTLAFAVDTTSVLKPITASIKSHTMRIVEDDLHVSEEKEASRYWVRAFNSGGNTVTTQTSDMEHFKSTISDLGNAVVRERDSCGGLPLSGILDTLEQLDDGSTLFLMAGAYPPGDTLAAEVISLAYAKDITIHSFHYRGGCGNDYVRLRASFKMKSVYDSFAAATGGLSYGNGIPQFQLSRLAGRLGQRNGDFKRLHVDGHAANQSTSSTEAVEAAETMDTPTISSDIQAAIQNKGDGTLILKIQDAFSKPQQRQGYSFPIDTTITDLKIALISKTTQIQLVQPNGTPLILPDDSVKTQPFAPSPPGGGMISGAGSITSTDLENGHFITLARPAVGNWKIIIQGSGEYTLDVYGTTTLHLHSFKLSKLQGRDGHEGYYAIPPSSPIKLGEEVSMVAEIRGPHRSGTARFEYRDGKGDVVVYPSMRAGSGKQGEANVNLFLGTGKVGGSSYWGSVMGRHWVYVVGKDEGGRDFQRVWRDAVEAVG